MAANGTQQALRSDLPALPKEWTYAPLASVIEETRGICYGIVQPGSHSEAGVPIVRVNNIRDGRIATNDVLHVSSEIEAKYKRSRLRGGEVLLSLVGSLGETAIVPPHLAGWNVARAVGVLPVNNSVGGRWVQLCLRSELIQHHIRMWATTTVQATFNLRDVARLPIPLPPQAERQAIACILGALDDKIELNRRRNQTLEGIARALFQSWFVDFDPVKAKAAGRAPAGLSPDLAAIFPATFEDSELGPIPASWRVSKLGAVADVNWGDTKVTKSSYTDRGFVAYSAKGPDGFLSYHDYDRVGIVVSAIGANSGFTWLARGKWSCIKNTLRLWASASDISTEYLFFATHGASIWPLRGSAQPFISQTDARNLSLLHPANSIAKQFGKLVDPLFAKLQTNDFESDTLSELRDALLPKLISGELRVPDAERIVGRAV